MRQSSSSSLDVNFLISPAKLPKLDEDIFVESLVLVNPECLVEFPPELLMVERAFFDVPLFFNDLKDFVDLPLLSVFFALFSIFFYADYYLISAFFSAGSGSKMLFILLTILLTILGWCFAPTTCFTSASSSLLLSFPAKEPPNDSREPYFFISALKSTYSSSEPL